MEKITIHRALAELKTIGSRIDKSIEEFTPAGMMQKDRPVNNFKPKEEFEKLVKQKFQSTTDLINRRNRIKTAIVQANSKVIVKIAGKEMTIADAINLRTTIVYQKKLIETSRKRNNKIKKLPLL